MPTPVLVDLDGVIRSGNRLLSGASEFVNFLEKGDFSCCFLSNNTKKPATVLRSFFKEKELDIPFPFLTALDATLHYIREHYNSAGIFADPNAIAIFGDLHNIIDPPAVVVGDLGEEWDYEVLNQIFRLLIREPKPELIAMQLNRYQKDNKNQLILDAGSFIKALEYAAETQSTLIGKPSPIFFNSALKTLGASSNEPFWMIGDDLEADIEAARQCGGTTILMLTGKTNREILKASKIKPDFVARNLKEAIQIIESHPL